MRIMVTGPQGSGKTTQAKILAEKLNLNFIGAGDLLREFSENESQESKEVKEKLENGQLVDDKVLAGLVEKESSGAEFKEGFVADGYPRSVSQLQIFNPQYDKVFYLKVSDKEAENRLVKRGRGDDLPELIKRRLKWYHEKTTPILNYYQDLGKLIIIDGEKDIEEVAKDIEKNVGQGVLNG